MRTRTIVLGALAVLLAAGTAFAAFAWHRSIEPISPPAANSFDPALVKRGAELAAIGNCAVCHTAPESKVLAGGRALPTPFGTIYSTNITPDPETGIGRWSEQAFRRAMREGVDRGGRHLYPAFPYDHFTLVTDQDNAALYAFLMSRDPVPAQIPANELRFPLNLRPLVAGWKLLFFRPGSYRPEAGQSEAWNRGAYLAEGLAHCGACHTPRNALGAERRNERFAGGEAEGWTAYALNRDSPAPVPWTAEALYAYLRHGWHEAHGIARGPMAPVAGNLASVPEADVRAIATYVASIAGEVPPERQRKGDALLANARKNGTADKAASGESQTNTGLAGGGPKDSADGGLGAAIYAAACGNCHESGRPLPFGGIDLALSTAPQGPNPHNVINVVLAGLPPTEGERSPIMPGFAGSMSDRQLAALVAYLRARFSDKPAWDSIERDVHAARSGERAAAVRPTPGSQSAPANAGQRGNAW
jgi:mono/diheme cytochrome c family protein